MNEFWMPAPRAEPLDFVSRVDEQLTATEQMVLRRLLRGESGTRRSKSAVHQRTAARRRRHKLGQLGIHDLRSLLQIMIRLGL